MLDYHPETYYVFLMTINFSLTLVVMLAACLCCKKKIPKNELLGLEGMVKLKNPDEVLVVAAAGSSESQADLNLSISTADSEKRASTAAHRSLPDIPISENIADNGSEFYETVADKHLLDSRESRDKSPTPSLKQQASVSQHSSISQADDISSPYSRVKNSPHGYAKVRSTEHPYAQLNAPSTSVALTASESQITVNSTTSNHDNQHVIRVSNQNLNEGQLQAEIPAASAIAGIIAASQDLPYMTPPISTQHFSGDSQDSSKGYTSISVREPLANILAQQPTKSEHCNPQLPRDVNDSHYATVSDDSDETYAAIEDPNGRPVTSAGVATAAAIDIYTSGSETYAQIQPKPNNSIVVSVEINNTSTIAATVSSSSILTTTAKPNSHTTNTSSNKSAAELTPIPPPVDSLRVQMHSRQASSSSNNSSMGNLGSPKPEKRQANSPLPPTPKSNASQQQFLSSSNSNLTSGRNSVISVIECSAGGLDASGGQTIASSAGPPDDSPQHKTKSLSPSKDIEGMYAKVMKKNKFSRNASSSQNNSPIMSRKHIEHDLNSVGVGVSPLDSAAAELTESHVLSMLKTDRTRTRSNSYSVKDHGYETIPADAIRMPAGGSMENRKSDCYTNILQKERQLEGAFKLSNPLSYKNAQPPRTETGLSFCDEKDYESIISQHQMANNTDPGYETLLKSNLTNFSVENKKKSSDYDPNYEVLNNSKYNHIASAAALSDDGYAKVVEKHRIALDEDSTDGYSKVKGAELEDSTTGGYSTIGEVRKTADSDTNHNYASILEANTNDIDSDHYARIADTNLKPATPTLLLDAVAKPATHVMLNDGVDGKNLRLPELPATPSPLTSSSLIANSSTASSTITSTSTLSSHQTPSSQYESLTGSDTDPNYESVCYLNTGVRENPYERLQTDLSDNQFSTPITPEECSRVVELQQASVSRNDLKVPCATNAEPNETVVVDDYFQV